MATFIEFFVCAACGYTIRRDYATARYIARRFDGSVVDAGYECLVRSDGNGATLLPSDDERAPCPSCGAKPHMVKKTALKKIKKTNHECDARCRAAISAECQCACGGSAHGIDHLPAV